jgi:hypothetical protein
VAIARYNAELMIKIAQQFGFTPGSRGRTWMIAGTPTSDLVELDENGLAAL